MTKKETVKEDKLDTLAVITLKDVVITIEKREPEMTREEIIRNIRFEL